MSRPTPAEREAQVKILVVASEEFQRAKNKPIAGIRAKMEAKEVRRRFSVLSREEGPDSSSSSPVAG